MTSVLIEGGNLDTEIDMAREMTLKTHKNIAMRLE